MVMGELAESAEVVVIGGGPGGYAAAASAARLGKEVILIEKERLGGVCLQHGCIPSKAIIHAVNTLQEMKQAASGAPRGLMGIRAGSVSFSVSDMQQWKNGIVAEITKGMASLCKALHITVINGTASFSSPRQLLISTPQGEKMLEFGDAVIATGSASSQLPGSAPVPFDGSYILSSTEALELDEIPERLAVIGGGYIGIELGTAYAKMGSKVTIIEATPFILSGMDQELVAVVEERLAALGVSILKETRVTRIDAVKKMVVFESKDGKKALDASKVIVCVGRIPNHRTLQLDKARIAVGSDGFIAVDQQQRTTNKNVFAIGDVVAGPMLAHKAARQGKVAAEVIAGKPSAYDSAVVPAVVYSDPEIAAAGMTEKEAQQQGYSVIVGRSSFKASGKALIAGRTAGLVKVVADAATRQVLGVHIAGENASDIISEAALAIEMCATIDDLSLTIHPHPTFSETMMEAGERAGK